jgi:AraC family transcriptional regulator
MPLEVIERPAITVVGMNIRTRNMSPEIPALWPKFVARIDEIGNPAEPRVSYGVMRAPAGMQALDYMAAVSVKPGGRVPDGMEALTIPAGTYTACRYPLAELGKGFGEIFNRLLPQSEYVQVTGPWFERYDEAFDARDPRSLVEICLPLRSRARGLTA